MFLRYQSRGFTIGASGTRLSCKYINDKLKKIKYDIYCKEAALLKIDSACKQGKNYHPQVYVDEFKYNDEESQQLNMLSDSNDGGHKQVY